MMDSRSIDFAKTATIDMMALNNKVVNMRQVVKRTKVHVISKLCKHITALKKKKGTDEQKAKNLRKAQRLIEEIDSMKKLKEDKVSKYALANVSSFSETSKISLSSGPRALARLADHPLMKKVVTDFRDQHSDWRDLAAYLLIKQTGRRFKTKKQKQTKLAKCVENIQASETMTKAYIKERFGQDGLAKAELRFERKRKRPKSAAIKGSSDALDADSKRQRSCSESNENNLEGAIQNQVVENNSETDANENTVIGKGMEIRRVSEMESEKIVQPETVADIASHDVSGESEEDETEVQVLKKDTPVSVNKNKIPLQHDDSDSSSGDSEADKIEESGSKDDKKVVSEEHSSDVEAEDHSSDVEAEDHSSDVEAEDHSSDVEAEDHSSDVEEKPVKTRKVKTKSKSECVVKELWLEGPSGDESSSSEDEDDDVSEEDAQSEDQSVEGDNTEGKKNKKKKEKSVPEMLTKANQPEMSDPFFAGSDDEEGDDTVNTEAYYSDDNMFEEDFDSGSYKAKSMFYNPTSDGSYAGGSRWSQRGAGTRGGFERGRRGGFERGRRGGFERRGHPGNFDRGQRGRSFSNDGRGRGAGFVGAGRGGSDRKFASQPSYERNSSNFPAKQSFSSDRFSTKNAAEHGRSHQTHTGSASDKQPTEKLHPSWEASKKRKAEQSSLKAFKGSKITFDDDD